MIALALTLVLAQVPLDSEIEEARLEPRFRWAAQAMGVFSVGAVTFGAGIGLQLEAGVVLEDTVSLTGRLFAATIAVSSDVGGTLGVDFAVGRFFTLGTGLSSHAFSFNEGGSAVMVGVPFRVTLNPMQRASDAVRRKTLIIGFELTPSLVILARGGGLPFTTRATVPDFGFSSMVTIGYGWW